MRRLQGGIPRAFDSHKTLDGALYGRYARAWAARFEGEIPDDLRPFLRLAGRLVAEVQGLERDYDAARTRRWMGEARSIRRQLLDARAQLLKVEERLDLRATAHPTDRDPACIGRRRDAVTTPETDYRVDPAAFIDTFLPRNETGKPWKLSAYPATRAEAGAALRRGLLTTRLLLWSELKTSGKTALAAALVVWWAMTRGPAEIRDLCKMQIATTNAKLR
jgi:hypothetical protein